MITLSFINNMNCPLSVLLFSWQCHDTALCAMIYHIVPSWQCHNLLNGSLQLTRPCSSMKNKPDWFRWLVCKCTSRYFYYKFYILNCFIQTAVHWVRRHCFEINVNEGEYVWHVNHKVLKWKTKRQIESKLFELLLS